jgi:regulator of cell morphogenesis and NO signaling
MTVIDPGTTLGAIVTAHPQLARELEARGLDYCCGGGRSLADACWEAGLDADAVAVDLSSRTDREDTPPDWTTMDTVSLVDHLVATHHRYLWEELPRLSALATKVVGVHGRNHPELATVTALLADLRADLEPHLTKEERVLFPMIRELAANTAPDAPALAAMVRAPVTVMMREHDTAGVLLARLRTTTHDYGVPDDACASYRALYEGLAALEADTHLHVHKENNVLFPAVLAGTLEPAAAPPERVR